MGVSKVYYTNMRTTLTENLLQKLARLVKRAGMTDIDFSNKYTAIKIHFGEPGNLAYLRPNYSKVLADLVKTQGGKGISHGLQHPVCGPQEECPGSPGRGL